MRNILSLLTLLLFVACAPPTASEESGATVAPHAERVAAATTRLRATPAGTRVLAAIDAHGGLQRWYAQSPLFFRFNYRPVGEGTIRDSYILNDYLRARAVHEVADERAVKYGFDGRDAWQYPAGAELAVSPRFWSLTPYYFVGLPFVLADEGIDFTELPATELDGTTYTPIKVTYASGTGDADDDYYILYLDPVTNELAALNYIVSYPGFFPDGEHLPEKLMRLTGTTTVAGIRLPTGYTTAWSDQPGEVITRITVSDYEFRPNTPATAFAQPKDAAVSNDLPGK